jgi:hypothetical protein
VYGCEEKSASTAKSDEPMSVHHGKTLPSLRLRAFVITDIGIRNATK